MFETVLRKKYALPHPNCRHEFISFYLDIESEEDIKKAIKDSKIKYDKNGNLVDVRFESDIKGYAAWQAGNRQRHEEYKQFQAMKAYYEGIEKEMPYKTLAGFRLARRREEKSAKYKAWKYRKADEKQFNRWIKIENFRNRPKTFEELQEIKYNNTAVDYEQLKRERKTIEKINAKEWTPEFKQKAIDTYYKFRDKSIEFTDHGVARFLSRITEEEFLEIHEMPVNYIQTDGRLVKFYNGYAIIYLQNTNEIVSIVKRSDAKGDWNEVEN